MHTVAFPASSSKASQISCIAILNKDEHSSFFLLSFIIIVDGLTDNKFFHVLYIQLYVLSSLNEGIIIIIIIISYGPDKVCYPHL